MFVLTYARNDALSVKPTSTSFFGLATMTLPFIAARSLIGRLMPSIVSDFVAAMPGVAAIAVIMAAPAAAVGGGAWCVAHPFPSVSREC